MSNETKLTRGGSTRVISNKQSRGITQDRTFNIQKTKKNFSSFKSVDKMHQTDPTRIHKQSVRFDSKVE